MKKYVKPEIKFENYKLSESIASACGNGVPGKWLVRGASTAEACYVTMEGVAETIFTTNINCDYKSVESFCQTTMSDNFGIIYGSY